MTNLSGQWVLFISRCHGYTQPTTFYAQLPLITVTFNLEILSYIIKTIPFNQISNHYLTSGQHRRGKCRSFCLGFCSEREISEILSLSRGSILRIIKFRHVNSIKLPVFTTGNRSLNIDDSPTFFMLFSFEFHFTILCFQNGGKVLSSHSLGWISIKFLPIIHSKTCFIMIHLSYHTHCAISNV